MKTWALTLGLGAVVGSVAILMIPRDNPTRKLAAKAALKIEDATAKIGNHICQTATNH